MQAPSDVSVDYVATTGKGTGGEESWQSLQVFGGSVFPGRQGTEKVPITALSNQGLG